MTDHDEWLNQFLATLQGVAIEWYSDMDKAKIIKKAFHAEFKLLWDDNEIVTEIYNAKQGRKETI